MVVIVSYVLNSNISFFPFETAQPHSLFGVARHPVDDTLSANDLGMMDIKCPFCNALHWRDERVSSSRINHPEFETCCAHGKVKLPPLHVPPPALYDLFVGQHVEAKNFRTEIVQYNAALAFTSLGVKVDHSIVGHGPPVFRIQGELTHLSGSLLPEPNVNPCYSQLYIHDPQTAYQY